MRNILLQQFDEYLEKQDVLNKLTEKQKLNEYGKIAIKNNAIKTCMKYFNSSKA